MHGRPRKIEDPTPGQVFGLWVVLGPAEGTRKFTCRCACGVERPISIYKLANGTAVGCPLCWSGVKRPLLRPGAVSGKWEVLEIFHRQYKGQSKRYARCRCSCGDEHVVSHAALWRRESSSCRRCAAASRRKTVDVGDLPGLYWNRVLSNASVRKLTVTCSQAYAWSLFLAQDRRCALSGLPLEFESKSGTECTASLDRIDSSVGYVEGNLQWVHKDINQMKMNLSDAYFIDLCRCVAHTADTAVRKEPV